VNYDQSPVLPGVLIGNCPLACMLLTAHCMKFFCRHCDEVATGKMYRVFSEEDGIMLLDMIVCRSCYDQARGLGLDSEEVKPDETFREQLPLVWPISAETHNQ
jgi:hypothetical protein